MVMVNSNDLVTGVICSRPAKRILKTMKNFYAFVVAKRPRTKTKNLINEASSTAKCQDDSLPDIKSQLRMSHWEACL